MVVCRPFDKETHIQNIDFKPPKHITSFSTLIGKILPLLDDACKYKIKELFNEGDLIEVALKLLKNSKLSGNKKKIFPD